MCACFLVSCVVSTLCVPHAQGHLDVDHLHGCLRPYLSGPVAAEAGRHVRGQIVRSCPTASLSHAWLGVWECVIRYHTSSRTCEDREGAGGGRVLIWSTQRRRWEAEAGIFFIVPCCVLCGGRFSEDAQQMEELWLCVNWNSSKRGNSCSGAAPAYSAAMETPSWLTQTSTSNERRENLN